MTDEERAVIQAAKDYKHAFENWSAKGLFRLQDVLFDAIDVLERSDDPFALTWRDHVWLWWRQWNPLLWKHRVAMRGFDDGLLYMWEGHGNTYNPPRFFFREAYDYEFNEGACK